MKKITTALLAVALCFFFAGHAMAQAQPRKPSTPELRAFEARGGKLEYLGKSFDVDGWLLVKRDGTPSNDVLYVTPTGAIIKGFLFSPAGDNITKTQFQLYKFRQGGSQKALPGADANNDAVPKAEQFYSAAEGANWVRMGMIDAPYIYMFINVNCEHCQSMFRTLKGSVEKGLLQLRVVPLGQMEENLNGGAALLSVDDPAGAWQKYMDGKKGELHKTKIKGDALEKMSANKQLAKKFAVPAPPYIISRKVSDGSLMTIVSKIDNPMQMMSDLMKLE